MRISTATLALVGALGALGSGACALSCSSTPEGTLAIVTGEETDTFSRAPAPTTLVASALALDGTEKELARTPLPTSSLSLGDLKRTDAAAISVRGLDATGATVIRGETLFFQWGTLELDSIDIFVQRTRELARVPNGPGSIAPTAAGVLAGRYVTIAGGAATTIYDLLALRTLSAGPTLPRPAESMVTFQTTALLIDHAGASVFDFTTSATSAINPAAGGTFDEVAGGQTVAARDGTQYVVGGTRAAGPSAKVLVIATDGTASWATLSVPREGACATWVEGRGLVVVGGSATGAGLEVLAAGASQATPLPFPAEPVHGCGAAGLDGSHVLFAGGLGGTGDPGSGLPARVADLTCATACNPLPWQGVVALARAEARPLAPDAALVVGDDAQGNTHVYRTSPLEAREILLRIPRRGARLVALPTLTFAVVGGAPGIEQYID